MDRHSETVQKKRNAAYGTYEAACGLEWSENVPALFDHVHIGIVVLIYVQSSSSAYPILRHRARSSAILIDLLPANPFKSSVKHCVYCSENKLFSISESKVVKKS